MQTWGVPNGNLKHTISTACRPGVFLTEISNIPSVQHADLGFLTEISNIPSVQHAESQTYRQYSMQTWGVPNGNLKHTVSTACRPGVFLTEISNIPSVQHADLGCS